MKSIVIVGSGPVGSFMAVLCAKLGFQVTVYEKREEFTRNINLRLENDFFKEVCDILSRLNVRTEFFASLNEYVRSHRNRILIKELEGRFAGEAKTLGAQYITREVESFEELYKEHRASDPIILDCTGRNSKLRIKEFGPDMDNIVTTPLQHAMYINFKAKITNSVFLYQAMKYNKNIKLTEFVLSKHKNKDGFSDVTLPVFITDELACMFDKEYPNISREPLNPFNSSEPVPDSIFFPISSLLGGLIVDGCSIDLNSVKVKKIEISCGYAKRRSRDKYICLGDSAIHLAFFRSLNLGLKQALGFFVKLSMLQANVQTPKDDEIIKQFQKHYPHLNPIRVYPTLAKNVFLVVTKVVWYGCFSYSLTNCSKKRLTNHVGVNESQINTILKELNKKFCSWSNLLAEFEAERDEGIKNEIVSNKTKSMLFDYMSWIVDIDGKSFIKISEFAYVASGKCSLCRKNFKFLLGCFKARREVIATMGTNSSISVIIILLNQLESKKFDQLMRICVNEGLSNEEKMKSISAVVNRKIKAKKLKGSLVKGMLNIDDIKVNSFLVLALIRNEIAEFEEPTSECNPTLDNGSFASAAEPTFQSSWMFQSSGIVKRATGYKRLKDIE